MSNRRLPLPPQMLPDPDEPSVGHLMKRMFLFLLIAGGVGTLVWLYFKALGNQAEEEYAVEDSVKRACGELWSQGFSGSIVGEEKMLGQMTSDLSRTKRLLEGPLSEEEQRRRRLSIGLGTGGPMPSLIVAPYQQGTVEVTFMFKGKHAFRLVLHPNLEESAHRLVEYSPLKEVADARQAEEMRREQLRQAIESGVSGGGTPAPDASPSSGTPAGDSAPAPADAPAAAPPAPAETVPTTPADAATTTQPE